MIDPDIDEALRLLGKRRMVLVVHDTSFPASAGEDLGHGSPYSREALAFLGHARRLGFDGVQLGPQGRTRPGDVSPYGSSLFSRNELALSLAALDEDAELEGLVPGELRARVVAAVAAHRHRTDHAAARGAFAAIAAAMHARGLARPDLRRVVRRFVEEHADWLLWDVRHDGRADPTASEQAIERFALTQLVLHRQHVAFRARLAALGMTVWGDLQIGMAPADEARFERLFLPGYQLGAPPSRTNPRGQPWGYPVWDPRRFVEGTDAATSVLAFFRQRMRKMAAEYDGVRVDHPHGLVCPWVYRSEMPNPLAAVQHGARLFESPALPDHPALAPLARVRPDQLNPDPSVPRHADDWVVDLTEAQVDAYGVLIDVIATAMPRQPGRGEPLVCEVLSTQPHPLRRVLARHGLGRYRVTQKADPRDPHDVYRSENAQPQDWIMVGNHDTPSIWRVARAWLGTERGAAEADHLARRLSPGTDPSLLAHTLRHDLAALVHAKFSDLFASRAEHVQMFFPDLLGIEETYNEPGTVGPHNWTLRVPPDWRAHAERARAGKALDVRRVLAGALRVRGMERTHGALVARLEGEAGRAGQRPVAQ